MKCHLLCLRIAFSRDRSGILAAVPADLARARPPGTLRGAATVMSGSAVASTSSAPSPGFAPHSATGRP